MLARVLTLLLCAASAADGQITAIRAGRLVDPDTGTVATNQVILVEKDKFTAVGANLRSPPGRGHRSVGDDGDAGTGGRAQPSGAHLQGRAREQRLLPHVRARLDAAARDPGRVQRHPDALGGLHDHARHGERWQLRRRRAAHGDRAGMDSRADDHQLRASSSAAWAGSSGPRPRWRWTRTLSTPSTSTPTRRTRSSKPSGRTRSSARG